MTAAATTDRKLQNQTFEPQNERQDHSKRKKSKDPIKISQEQEEYD
jgi:hypothetical protein